jgi:hypothetical protein
MSPTHQRMVITVSTASDCNYKKDTLAHVSGKRLTMQPWTFPGGALSCAFAWNCDDHRGLLDPPNNAKVPCTTIYRLFYIENIYYMVSLYKAECSIICYPISGDGLCCRHL